MKKLLFSVCCAICTMFAVTSCECEHDLEPPKPFKLGWVVCTDGNIISFCDYATGGHEAVAIVYKVCDDDPESDIAGYAVYLNDTKPLEFADSLNVEQGTSADIHALDGNENTYSIYSTEDVGSPLAQNVFDLWTFGQSAYVPSVAQLRQILEVKDFINPRIEAIGGDPLIDDPLECWYWSSTEVDGQQDVKSWLVSMKSGALQETPKDQPHKSRPVITIYK